MRQERVTVTKYEKVLSMGGQVSGTESNGNTVREIEEDNTNDIEGYEDTDYGDDRKASEDGCTECEGEAGNYMFSVFVTLKLLTFTFALRGNTSKLSPFVIRAWAERHKRRDARRIP